ncbi:hypothetical protein V8C26DRAFT_94777 [Trichoderma gracile]
MMARIYAGPELPGVADCCDWAAASSSRCSIDTAGYDADHMLPRLLVLAGRATRSCLICLLRPLCMWLWLLVSSLNLGKGTMPAHTKLLPGCVTYAAAIPFGIALTCFFPSRMLYHRDFAWALVPASYMQTHWQQGCHVSDNRRRRDSRPIKADTSHWMIGTGRPQCRSSRNLARFQLFGNPWTSLRTFTTYTVLPRNYYVPWYGKPDEPQRYNTGTKALLYRAIHILRHPIAFLTVFTLRNRSRISLTTVIPQICSKTYGWCRTAIDRHHLLMIPSTGI